MCFQHINPREGGGGADLVATCVATTPVIYVGVVIPVLLRMMWLAVIIHSSNGTKDVIRNRGM